MFERKKKRKKEKTSYNETEDREMEIVDGIRSIEISSNTIWIIIEIDFFFG